MNPSPLFCIPSDDTTFSTLPDCKCDPCAQMGVTLIQDSLVAPQSQNPEEVTLKGSFTGIDLGQVLKITAEIVHFDLVQRDDTACGSCVNSSRNYGNFTLPASMVSGFAAPVLSQPDYGRLVTWQNENPQNCPDNAPPGEPAGQGGTPADFSIAIVVPAHYSLPCCGDKITVCVRYTVYDFCCRSCEIIKCYEINRGN